MKKVVLFTLSTLVFVVFALPFLGVVYGIEEKVCDGITYECVGDKLSIINVDPAIKILNICKKIRD